MLDRAGDVAEAEARTCAVQMAAEAEDEALVYGATTRLELAEGATDVHTVMGEATGRVGGRAASAWTGVVGKARTLLLLLLLAPPLVVGEPRFS